MNAYTYIAPIRQEFLEAIAAEQMTKLSLCANASMDTVEVCSSVVTKEVTTTRRRTTTPTTR